MDRQQARQVLQSLRPKDVNTDKPIVIEALVYVESDPELKAWWEAEQAFDRKVAAKVTEFPVPSGLRDSILAGRKVVQFTPRPQLSYWLAAAAAVAVLCVVGTSLEISAHAPMPRAEYTAMVLPMLNHDAPPLGMTSPDQDKITAWLRERNAPVGTLPVKMTALSTVGCQKFLVHGHGVSLICFALAGGGIAHLFVIEEAALADPPGNNGPEMNQVQEWSTAAWSDGHMSYLLATEAGPEALKQLL